MNEWEDMLAKWPNCSTPDCENKRCTWSGLDLCFPCAEKVIGHDELVRRFNATHELTWEAAQRLDMIEDLHEPPE